MNTWTIPAFGYSSNRITERVQICYPMSLVRTEFGYTALTGRPSEQFHGAGSSSMFLELRIPTSPTEFWECYDDADALSRHYHQE